MVTGFSRPPKGQGSRSTGPAESTTNCRPRVVLTALAFKSASQRLLGHEKLRPFYSVFLFFEKKKSKIPGGHGYPRQHFHPSPDPHRHMPNLRCVVHIRRPDFQSGGLASSHVQTGLAEAREPCGGLAEVAAPRFPSKGKSRKAR